LMNKERNGYAPGPLSRNAPVGAVFEHAGDALLAPGGRPGHFFDIAQRMLAQLLGLHADEPLRGRAKYERRLMAPAMRIAVLVGLMPEEPTLLLEHRDDVRVCIPNQLAGEERRTALEATVIAHGIIDRQSVALCDHPVIEPMCGRGVHDAGTDFERDMLAKNDRYDALVKRVMKPNALKRAPIHARDIVIRCGGLLDAFLGVAVDAPAQVARQEQAAAVGRDERIEKIRIDAQGFIRRQRPRSRGP